MAIFDFLLDRASIKQVNEVLALPRYTRAEMLAFTQPRIDSTQFANWVRRGFLDFEKQIGIGTAKDFRELADTMRKNKKLGAWRRYTGGDILKVMTLNVISQSGIPFSLVREINNIVLERATVALLEKPTDEFVIRVTFDRDTGYGVAAVPATDRNGGGEWHLIIEIDRMIARFLKSGRGRQTVEMPADTAIRDRKK